MSLRITGLSLERFRNLPEFSLAPADGFVVVKGPNEAGKSSLVEAVFFALFRDAGSTAAEIKAATTWGLESRPCVELRFAADEQQYVLRRDYAAKKNRLRNESTGDEWHDKKTIAQRVADLLGLGSESLVRSTVCVQADELQRVAQARDDLRPLLEQKVSGVGDVDLTAIDAALEVEIRAIRPPRKQGVGLPKAALDLAVARRRRDEVAGALDEQAALRESFYAGQDELPRLSNELSLVGVALERARSFAESKAKAEAANAWLDEAMNQVRNRADAESERAAATSELDEILPALTEAAQRAEREATAVARRELLQERLTQARADRDRLDRLIAEIEVLRQARADAQAALDAVGPAPEPSEVQRLGRLQARAEALGQVLAAQGAIIEVTAKTDVVVRLGESVHELPAGEHVTDRFVGELAVTIGDVADVRVSAGSPEIEKQTAERDALAAEVAGRLNEYGVADLTELAERAAKRDELVGTSRSADERLRILLAGQDEPALKEQRAAVAADVAAAAAELTGLPGVTTASAERDELQRRVEALRARISAAGGRLHDLPAAEELQRRQRAAAKEALKADESLKEFEPYALPPHELVKLERRAAELEARERQLQVDLRVWEKQLDGAFEAADLVAAEVAVAAAQARVARLRHRLAVLELVQEVLAEARLSVGGSLADVVAGRATEIFTAVTQGRYDDVRVDAETLEFQVHRPGGSGESWVRASSPPLSTGTLDQLYLAARVALAEAIVHDRRPFWILDDPLAHADPWRCRQALAVLKQIARDRQVILFTCHDYGDESADQVIELGELVSAGPQP